MTRGQTSSTRKIIAVGFCLAIMPWSFDFKSKVSGQGILLQGSIALVSLIGFFLVLSSRAKISGKRAFSILFLACLLFGIDGLLVGLFRGQSTYELFVHVAPLILFCVSARATQVLLSSYRSTATFLLILKLCCILCMVVTVLLVFQNGDTDISTVRYEILGASVVAASAFLVVSLSTRFAFLDFVNALTVITVILISVTRTNLIVFVLQICSIATGIRGLLMARSVSIVIFAYFVAAGFIAMQIVNVDIANRWQDRLFQSEQHGGDDPTYLIRVGESKFMWEQILKDEASIFFGNGFASRTAISRIEFELVSKIVGRKSAELESVGYGHNNHLSQLFIGGFVGGLPLLLLLGFDCFRSIGFIRASRLTLKDLNAKTESGQVFLIACWAMCTIIGNFGYGMFAGTFDSRGVSIWYGIATGAMYWCMETKRIVRQ